MSRATGQASPPCRGRRVRSASETLPNSVERRVERGNASTGPGGMDWIADALVRRGKFIYDELMMLIQGSWYAHVWEIRGSEIECSSTSGFERLCTGERGDVVRVKARHRRRHRAMGNVMVMRMRARITQTRRKQKHT